MSARSANRTDWKTNLGLHIVSLTSASVLSCSTIDDVSSIDSPTTNAHRGSKRINDPVRETIKEVFLSAFEELEQFGWRCNTDCVADRTVCAFHFFARRTDHLEVLCGAMNLSRELVVERCVEHLRRFAARVYKPTGPGDDLRLATAKARAIIEAQSLAVEPAERLADRREASLHNVERDEKNRCRHCMNPLPKLVMRFCDDRCRYLFKRDVTDNRNAKRKCHTCEGPLTGRRWRFCSSKCYNARSSYADKHFASH